MVKSELIEALKNIPMECEIRVELKDENFSRPIRVVCKVPHMNEIHLLTFVPGEDGEI